MVFLRIFMTIQSIISSFTWSNVHVEKKDVSSVTAITNALLNLILFLSVFPSSVCSVQNALFPMPSFRSILVPYSQIPLHDQQQILDCTEKGMDTGTVMENNLLIDENNIKHIIRQFRKHWRQRLLSAALNILDDLTAPCLRVYSRQFMQIHRTRNKLCTYTNTA